MLISLFLFSYKTLLEEFEATSFGDYVFSQYLILPLFCDTLGKKCRSMIWSTERTAIYLIKLQRETV